MTARNPQPLLVFGDDGTPPSDLVWEWLNGHSWAGWAIDVMTARFEEHQVEWGRPPRAEPWQPSWQRTTSPRLGADPIRFLQVTADPRVMLAGRADADLIVVGIRPRAHLEALWMGSTTEWLLQHPPAPLVVVRSPDSVVRVVVCLDGSEHSMLALSAYTSLPLSAGADATILVVDDGRVAVRDVVDRAGTVLAERGLEAKVETTPGRPTTVILDHLDRERPDLVVLGTRGLTGWERLRVGSTAAAVVRAAPSSCLVACADDEAADER